MKRRLERPDHTLMRDRVTQLFAGMHYRTEEFQQVSAVFDWQNVWPLIDADGDLTGDVVEPAEDGVYLILSDWDAAIRREDAVSAGWEIDADGGTARPPIAWSQLSRK